MEVTKVLRASPRCCLQGVDFCPSSMRILTPCSVLSAVSRVQIIPFRLASLRRGHRVHHSLRRVHKTGFVPTRIDVAIRISVCARGAIRIPILKIGFPPAGKLQAFPSAISIAFEIKVDQFGRLSKSSFILTMGCRRLVGRGPAGVGLHVASLPRNISGIQVRPARISCLVRRVRRRERKR